MDIKKEYEARYQEALAIEQDAYQLAFLDSFPLDGYNVKHLTFRTLLYLEGLKNPLVCGGPVFPEHVAQYFAVVNQATPDKAFYRAISDVNYERAIKELSEHVRISFGLMMFAQSDSSVKGYRQYASYVASWVDFFSSEYGWDDESILDKPILRLGQYARCRMAAKGDDTAIVTESDKIIHEYFKKVNGGLNE